MREKNIYFFSILGKYDLKTCDKVERIESSQYRVLHYYFNWTGAQTLWLRSNKIIGG